MRVCSGGEGREWKMEERGEGKTESKGEKAEGWREVRKEGIEKDGEGSVRRIGADEM